MNYNRINWTTKTGITQTDLDIMDAGLDEAATEINDMKASVIALQNSNIQRGYYVFAKNTSVDQNKIAVATITTKYSFFDNATIVAVPNTSRPDFYRVSIARIEDSNNSFNLYFHASSGAIADNKLMYKVGVHWIIIS